ncbi:basement membrane proteoglycan-like [Uranotaenia lowii]|uniref:basement membrane proteoglycan-like n=1 Tax=Uranotaenia lowii TaxID=190385 RepID=UPI002479C3B4|nr:basement membrane proteoglycan-like [Uranotaenia lowii]
MFPRVVILFAGLWLSSGLELKPTEKYAQQHLTAIVPYGKRLKLTVVNVFHPGLRWRHDGGPVSEKCETTINGATNSLVCANMDWSDAGLYEYQAIRQDGTKDVLLSVNVKVAECTEQLAEAARRQQENNTNVVNLSVSNEFTEEQSETLKDECYCSGITDQCVKADNLFRSRISFNVTEADMVDLKITEDTVNESWHVDSPEESWTYYSLPIWMLGNLLKSYGGYFEFPANDDGIDEDGPDLVIKGRVYSMVYHNRRELLSGEVIRSKVLLHEQNWRLLNGDPVPKHVFMSVLSKVRAFYVKCNLYRRLDPQEIVLESADLKDQGLGTVSTVESCTCREGYRGLSCEDCDKGYYRRQAVGLQGICVSIQEKWNSLKASIGWRQKLENLRQRSSY